MTTNYFRITLRNLLKNKGFSFINILGLTLGIASSILIMLFVFFEFSYDKYHEDADRVYRLAVKAMIGDTRINDTNSSSRVLREIREKYPEIEEAVKIFSMENVLLRVENDQHAEPVFLGADSSLFDVMTFEFVIGNKESALNKPNTIVLTRSTAEKYFGQIDVVGRELEFDLQWGYGTVPFEVSAVIEDIPANSHLHFDHVASMTTFPDLISENGWMYNNFKTYLKLHTGTDQLKLEAKFKDYVIESMGEGYESFASKGGFWEFFLQPITSIHLNSDLNGEFEQNGNKKYVYIFSIIALFVLIIACINFMNLSTAKSALRGREVGIRKISGSTRSMLIRQFLSEAVVLSLIALFLAVILVELCLPGFRNLVGKPLSLPLWDSFHWWPILIVGGFLIGILSGIYPAFFLSAYKPITVLKGKIASGKKGSGFRNTLVVIQFAASIFLIIGTIVIQRQFNFLQNTDLGFEKSEVVSLKLSPGFEPFKETFRQEIKTDTDVLMITTGSGLPGERFVNRVFSYPTVEDNFTLNVFTCDYNYMDVLEMNMLEGRFFSESFSTDSLAVVINETTALALNLENPIGTIIRTGDSSPEFTIIGVIKDYNYESMHSEIRPLGLFLQGGQMDRPLQSLAVKINRGNNKRIIQLLEKTWNDIVPEMPFSYSFLDDNYNSLYNNESLTKKVFYLLSLLAIIVASLGLFGLASFITENRRKEVGIRKVMGASVEKIILILSSQFSLWVGVSFIIAAPVAWFVMNQWLQNFVYKQELSWWIFIIAGGLALFISLLTISTITWKAATRNPIESMRYE